MRIAQVAPLYESVPPKLYGATQRIISYLTEELVRLGHLPVDHGPLFKEFSDAPLVSISDEQRRPLPDANWQAAVPHGLPPDLLRFCERPGDYLVFLGRIAPEKRVDRAIEIARRAGKKLKIAAKFGFGERDYFQHEIEPLLRASRDFVEYLGEVDDAGKNEILGNAAALLFPIDWPEPFGLVVIEALACGTPVVAFRCGAMPEILDDGETGFLVDSVEEAVRAVGRITELSRRVCRQAFEEWFTAERMTRDYLRVYQRLILQRPRYENCFGDLRP